MPHVFLIKNNIWFIVTLIISLINIGIGSIVIFTEIYMEEMAAGWSVSFVNNVAHDKATPIKRIEQSADSFVRSLGFNFIRVVVFLMISVSFMTFTNFTIKPFMYALFGTYFIFLAYEVLRLHYLSNRLDS